MDTSTTKTPPAKPECLKDEHLGFLDALRDMGAINMYGAAAPLREMYELTPDESRAILAYWMATFSQRHPKA